MCAFIYQAFWKAEIAAYLLITCCPEELGTFPLLESTLNDLLVSFDHCIEVVVRICGVGLLTSGCSVLNVPYVLPDFIEPNSATVARTKHDSAILSIFIGAIVGNITTLLI